MKFEELTHKIIGCAKRVHTALGNGFQEVIYQRAMVIELTDNDMSSTGSLKCLCITKINKLEQEE